MNAATIEASMILRDARDVARIASALANGSVSSNILGLGFLPVASFFVVETYDALRRHGLRAHRFLEQNAARVRQARARLKLLDSNGFDAAMRHLGAIEQTSYRMFNSGHQGVLARIKRWLQDDLGLYFIGPDLVCTTHIALLNFTYDEERLEQFDHGTQAELGSELHSFSQGLGEFISGVAQALGEPFSLPDPPASSLAVSAEDHKARVAYGRISARLQVEGVPVAAVFTWLASQVNFIHCGLRTLVEPDSDLYFRIRFLTVFHLLRAFQKLGVLLRGDRASLLGLIVAETLSRDGARRIRRLGRLRNAVAHYDGTPMAQVHGSPLDLLVSTLSRMERGAVSILLDEQLETARVSFRQVVTKGVLGRREVLL